MLLPRLIPCLLFDDGALVKTVRFASPQYVGDPLNVVHIFNEKEVDELLFLDIGATREGREPDFATLKLIASEAFMPLGYGGGVKSLETIARIFETGFEKVVVNTGVHEVPDLVESASRRFGSQSIVVSVDVKKGFFGEQRVFTRCGTTKVGEHPVDLCRRMEGAGAGEILLTSMDRDGTWDGYDFDLVESVTQAVSIPVVACGGAGSLSDCGRVVREAGASAAAAGSIFVYQKKDYGVLIQYPDYEEIRAALG